MKQITYILVLAIGGSLFWLSLALIHVPLVYYAYLPWF